MLKSKKSLYVLIPLTLVIWGIVAYNIYTGLNPEFPPVEPVDRSRFRESEINEKQLETFLEPEYNPFSGKTYVSKKELVRSSKNENKQRRIQPIKWPQVTYLGFIKDKASRKKVAAFKVNGNIRTFKNRETIDSLALVSANGEKAVMRYKSQRKEFKK